MRLRITYFAIFVGALFFAWSPSSFAAMPSGTMVFEFNEDNIYSLNKIKTCKSGDGLTLCMTVKMVANARGKFSGTARFQFSGWAKGKLKGPASGSVSEKSGGKVKAKVKMATKGSIRLSGTGSLKSTYDLDCSGIIGASGTYTAKCKFKLFIRGFGTENGRDKFIEQLKGGPWALTVKLNPLNATKLNGTGTDTLGYKYKVTGKYSASEDTSEVEVIGRNKISKGAKIVLKDLTEAGAAEARYKVQGYKGSAQVQAGIP